MITELPEDSELSFKPTEAGKQAAQDYLVSTLGFTREAAKEIVPVPQKD